MKTKFNEEILITTDLKKMLGKYISKDILRTWKEDFIDEDSGEVIAIERSEILFNKGTLVDKDTATRINFYMQEGAIKAVEVSNHARLANKINNNGLFISQIEISPKKKNILCYANNIDVAEKIISDYVELNYSGNYRFNSIKEYENCTILSNPKKESDENKKWFYKITCDIYCNGDFWTVYRFLAHATNINECMSMINSYIEDNINNIGEWSIMLEELKKVAISEMVPEEFSEEFIKNGKG